MSVIFSYKAVDKIGQVIKGMVEALDKDSALKRIENLREQGLSDIQIEDAKMDDKKPATENAQNPETKKCPFCFEEIKYEAVFCRFCNKSLSNTEAKEIIIYDGKVSFKHYAFLIALSVLFIPLYGLGLIFLFLIWVKVKSEHYKITNQFVETATGIITRKHDSMDNWRIKDIQFSRGPIEALFNLGTIIIYSMDKTSPTITIRGLHNSKIIYQRLKDEAFRQRAERKVSGMELS